MRITIEARHELACARSLRAVRICDQGGVTKKQRRGGRRHAGARVGERAAAREKLSQARRSKCRTSCSGHTRELANMGRTGFEQLVFHVSMEAVGLSSVPVAPKVSMGVPELGTRSGLRHACSSPGSSLSWTLLVEDLIAGWPRNENIKRSSDLGVYTGSRGKRRSCVRNLIVAAGHWASPGSEERETLCMNKADVESRLCEMERRWRRPKLCLVRRRQLPEFWLACLLPGPPPNSFPHPLSPAHIARGSNGLPRRSSSGAGAKSRRPRRSGPECWVKHKFTAQEGISLRARCREMYLLRRSLRMNSWLRSRIARVEQPP